MTKIKVSAWNDGKHNLKGNGYGISVGKKGRKFFKKDITSINLSIENSYFIQVKITNGFWNKCTEFRDKRIGEWMITNNLAPWKNRKNPKFNLTVLENNKFHLERINTEA